MLFLLSSSMRKQSGGRRGQRGLARFGPEPEGTAWCHQRTRRGSGSPGSTLTQGASVEPGVCPRQLGASPRSASGCLQGRWRLLWGMRGGWGTWGQPSCSIGAARSAAAAAGFAWWRWSGASLQTGFQPWQGRRELLWALVELAAAVRLSLRAQPAPRKINREIPWLLSWKSEWTLRL